MFPMYNIIHMDLDAVEELDDSWLREFEKTDNEYKAYYKEDLTFVKLHCVYINDDCEIDFVKEQRLWFREPNVLYKEDLISAIKHNAFQNNCKYSLLSILKYNITLEPFDLKTFLRGNNKRQNKRDYLQSVHNIDTIVFDKSISMFHDINDLFIVFHMKKTIGTGTGTGTRSGNAVTKRIYIPPIRRKQTKRKELKDSNTNYSTELTTDNVSTHSSP